MEEEIKKNKGNGKIQLAAIISIQIIFLALAFYFNFFEYTGLVSLTTPQNITTDGIKDQYYSNPLQQCDSTNLNGMNVGQLYTYIDPNGDVNVYYEQSKDLNDNTYGTNTVNWPRSHSFSDLVGSDKAQFVFRDLNGSVVLDITVDYITSTNTKPSGYASLGVNGGEGRINTGTASYILGATTSLDYNFNTLGCVLTANSPPAYTNYTQTNATCPGWIFENAYELKISKAAFGAVGFGSVDVVSVHDSPPKKGTNAVYPEDCETCQDSDNDIICDSEDNCPNVNNPSQSDIDMDGIGDACETTNQTNETCALLIDGKLDSGCAYNTYVNKCDYTNLNGLSTGTLYYHIGATGDVSVYYEQSKGLNDNTYGTNIVNWPRSHTFSDLVGSDKAEFVFKDSTGKIVLDFFVDYITATNTKPSGYASLGVSGGEGRMNVGSASDVIGAKTSLDYNFNVLGHVLTTNSPQTVSSTSYTLVNGSQYSGWIFEDAYEVKVSAEAFGAAGFGSVEVVSVHDSPPKTGSNENNPETCKVSCSDADGDTYSVSGGSCGTLDCNDMNNSIHPGAIEICNGVDDDCDSIIDEGCGINNTNCTGVVVDGKIEDCYTNPTPQCDNTTLNGMVVGQLYTYTDANGDINIYYDQSKNLNDNTYGTNIVNWPRSHSFSDLVGSDGAEFLFKDKNGNTVLDFNVDYITATNTVSSGYASLGVNGGEGKMIIGSSSNILAAKTSLDYNFNVLGCALTINSPPADSDYNPTDLTCPNWIYSDAYEVKVSGAAFGSAGFGSVEIVKVHDSPPKTGSNAVYPKPCQCEDEDNDKICDDKDNCVDDYNPGQEDSDMDGIGDACDCDDTDNDTICNYEDNCPDAYNPDQNDSDYMDTPLEQCINNVPCGECKGGITRITLTYNGPSGNLTIYEGNYQTADKLLFSGYITNGSNFTLTGKKERYNIAKDISLYINKALNTKIHTSCSQPIAPGMIFGSFKIIEGVSKYNGPLCPLHPTNSCGECKGGITSLTLKYTGPSGNITIYEGDYLRQDKMLFSGYVSTEANIILTGKKYNYKIAEDITLYVNGTLNTKIDLHCSKSKIVLGMTFGNFTILSGISKYNGPLCATYTNISCSECKGGLTSLTLRYNGPNGNVTIFEGKYLKQDKILFSSYLTTGSNFTLTGKKERYNIAKDISLYINKALNTKIHTSCSQPIAPGMIFGNFTILSGISKYNGLLCPVPNYPLCPSKGDGVGDECDNCRYIYNPDQEDNDSDTIGDECDNCQYITNTNQSDVDNDIVGDACDNCPYIYNPGQEDTDMDGMGDLCDINCSDYDNDTICDPYDNCNITYNPGQEDYDDDSIGNACDNCPYIYNPDQKDTDMDGKGDLCDVNDTAPPTVNLTSPPNGTVANQTLINFTYIPKDNQSDISYCVLIINGTVYQSDNTITVNITNSFIQTLVNGYYHWSVNCTDIYGNRGSSQIWTLTINSTQPVINVTGNATSCCCNLDVTTTPRIAEINEKVLIAADVNVEQFGIPAEQANITSINVTIYKVENNTQVVVIKNQPMLYLNNGLWYYTLENGFNQTGNYIASVTMTTNQTPSFTKQTSYTFSVRDSGSGLYIQGVSPDMINLNDLTRLAAEVMFNGKPIDAIKLTNAILEVTQLNGTTQTYNATTGLLVDDGMLYVDGAFNGTGVYYLNWTVNYLGEQRSAKEIVVVVDWDDKLSNITVNINSSAFQEVINLINENKKYLINLLKSMEFMNEFTQEEIFLVTDSVNSMTSIVNFLEEGKLTPEQAQEEFGLLQAKLQKELGSKLLGGVITPIEPIDVEKESRNKRYVPLILIAIAMLIGLILSRKKISGIMQAKKKQYQERKQNTNTQENIITAGNRAEENLQQEEKNPQTKQAIVWLVETAAEAKEIASKMMQMPRAKLYLAVIAALAGALVLLKITSPITGFVIGEDGIFRLLESKENITLNGALSFIVIAFLVVLLIAGARKTAAYLKVERKDANERSRSIKKLMSSDEKIFRKIKPKDEQDTADDKSKQRICINKGRELKTKISVLKRKDETIAEGITPKQFSYDETVFTHNRPKDTGWLTGKEKIAIENMQQRHLMQENDIQENEAKEDEMINGERRYEKANLPISVAEMAAEDVKQEIINAGLSEYIDKHQKEQAEYVEIPYRKRRTKDSMIKIFRLAEKDDLYPILECMRDNRHVIIVTAGAMLNKDPEMVRKFARQLDYVGMVYDARLTALDESNFAIIPKFARFEP